MTGKRYIIFDLDGTLVDSFATVVNACKQVLAERHADLPDDTYFASYRCKDMETMFAELAARAEMPIDDFREAYDNHYAADCLTGTMPIEKTLALLTEAKQQGTGSIVITNKKQQLAERVCSEILGPDTVDIIIGRLDAWPIKPRHVLHDRLGTYGIHPSADCISYYGDSDTDYKTAKLLNVQYFNIKLC